MQENEMIGGKYRIIRKIGSGGTGNVYLAEDINVGRKAAIKEITICDPEQKCILRSEMDIMKSLGGGRSGMPEIYDWIYENGETYLVMEYIEGITLREYLTLNRYPDEKLACSWGREILETLSYLHGQEPPFIYQDLKSSNVMVCPDGHVRLIDFGSSFRMRFDGTKSDSTGTRGYASPEQLEGRTQPCPQSDVYSWGRLMQEMLSGIDMSRDDSCYEQAAAIYDGEISYGLAKIIRKCTYEQKEKRYAGAAEVIAALDGKKNLNSQFNIYIALLRAGALFPAAAALIKGVVDGVATRLMKLSFEDISSWKTVLMGERKNLIIIAAMIMISYLLYENIGIRHFDKVRRVNGMLLTEMRPYCLRFVPILLAGAVCFGSLVHSQNADASECLPVTVYDKEGHKVLIRDGAVYETHGAFIFSVDKEDDSEAVLTLSLTDAESGNAGTRTFYLGRADK